MRDERGWAVRRSKACLTIAILACALFPLTLCSCSGAVSPLLLTPDQRGHRRFERGEYEAAAALFTNPMWRGVSLFKQGEFKKAAGVFSGYDTADAAFNHGNALVMQGKYEEAVERYDRSLALNPAWERAVVNREIALARAKMLKKEGGDMTGGQMEADEIVFTEAKPPPSAGDEQTDGGPPMNDAELRAIWLRQVRTKPADFLRAKFAYQHARDNRQGVSGK